MSDEIKQDAQVPSVGEEGGATSEGLSADALSEVVGGRKAGKGQQEFLVVKMNDVIITGVS